MSRWSEFYQDRMNDQYRQHLADRYHDFIALVASQHGHRFAEYGCGGGNITRILIEKFGLQAAGHTCVDIDRDILGLAQRHMPHPNVEFREANICTMQPGERFDVIHSHGVLEHMTDDQIRQAILCQLPSAKQALVHYVPSWKYERPSYGDERLMKSEDWKRICEPTEVIEFNNGFDLILYWRIR